MPDGKSKGKSGVSCFSCFSCISKPPKGQIPQNLKKPPIPEEKPVSPIKIVSRDNSPKSNRLSSSDSLHNEAQAAGQDIIVKRTFSQKNAADPVRLSLDKYAL